MNKIPYFIISTLIFCACNSNQKGELLLVESNANIGFNFPYFLFIPGGTSLHEKTILIVEPNNSGFADDSLKKQKEQRVKISISVIM